MLQPTGFSFVEHALSSGKNYESLLDGKEEACITIRVYWPFKEVLAKKWCLLSRNKAILFWLEFALFLSYANLQVLTNKYPKYQRRSMHNYSSVLTIQGGTG